MDNICTHVSEIHGFFYDPFHGGCHRYIDGFGNIVGTYGTDEKQAGKLYSNHIVYCDPHDFTHSKIAMTRIKNQSNKKFRKFLNKIDKNDGQFLCLVIDFQEKTHVDHDRYYIALFHRRTKQIHWEDGNTWYFGCYKTSSPFDFFFHVPKFPIHKYNSSPMKSKSKAKPKPKPKTTRSSRSNFNAYVPYVSLKRNKRIKRK